MPLRDERAREQLGLGHLGDRIDHPPSELSSGERQRITIAQALSVHSSILLVNEPTGNLDTRTGREITALISDLPLRLGSVTDDMKVSRSCGQMIALRDGRAVADVERPSVGRGLTE